MQKKIIFLLFVILVLSLSACGVTYNETQDESSYYAETAVPESAESEDETEILLGETEISDNSEGQKVLVAYFSWADNAEQDTIDAVTSASVTVPGNVAQLAAWVSEETDGDLFSIQVIDPYPTDWDECLNRANQEKADGTLPELVRQVEDMEEYDVVFLGYPNWWYSCPMAVLSFIEAHDFSDKQIYLFCSHGTGGLARSVQDITAALPDANIADNVFHVYQYDVPEAKEDLLSWLEDVGY